MAPFVHVIDPIQLAIDKKSDIQTYGVKETENTETTQKNNASSNS